MSNLREFLRKRRSKFYEGESLQQSIDAFMEIVDGGAVVHEFPDAVIVLEDYGLPGNVRGWLLFDKFTKGTASAIKKVSDEFQGKAIYASTHDERIRNLLVKFGYEQYLRDEHDFYLVKLGVGYGM